MLNKAPSKKKKAAKKKAIKKKAAKAIKNEEAISEIQAMAHDECDEHGGAPQFLFQAMEAPQGPPVVRTRSLSIDTPITGRVADSIIKNLTFLEAEDPNEEISIYVNSPGGDVYSAFAIYDIMTNMKCPISTIGYGCVMSAGVLVISAGNKGRRYAFPHTHFMTHDMQVFSGGSLKDAEAQHAHFQRMKDKYYDLTIKNSKLTKSKIKNYLSHETYFDSKVALELGFIDKIEVRKPKIFFENMGPWG